MASRPDPLFRETSSEARRLETERLIRDVVAGAGAELVDLTLGVGSRRPSLRVYVDVPGGTTADALAKLSRKIEERLDATGVLGERYALEVSSPGLDRPLRTRRDFERLLGRDVALRTAGGGPREILGVLEEVGEEPEGSGFWIRVRLARRDEPLRLVASEIESARAHTPW